MATWDTQILEPVWSDGNVLRPGQATARPAAQSPVATAAPPAPAPKRPSEPLSDRAIHFIATLAGKASLMHTAEQQPHVVNDLAPYRRNPAKSLEIIQDFLAIDARSHERFSFAVLNELHDLQAFFRKRLAEIKQA